MVRASIQESTGRLKGVIHVTNPILKCRIHTERPVLKGRINISRGSTEVYDGDYDVIPRLYSQILETNTKFMMDDVTVEEIPVLKTSNLQGGWTVLIG